MVESYLGVRRSANVEIERKRSRFIGIATIAQNEIEAESEIDKARRLYPGATHHCFAYRVGLEGSTTRFNDDREPQGTAGRPILDVIEKSDLQNVTLIVVRYFGGTQLGAGGLARAYRAAAAAAVEQAGMVKYSLHATFRGEATYADWAKMETGMRQLGVASIQTEYMETVRFTGSVEALRLKEVSQALTDMSAGAVRIKPTGTEYVAEPASID